MKRMSIATALIVGSCAFAWAGTVSYDLNNSGDLTNAFHTAYTGSPVSQSTTGGLGNSGALNFRSGGGNQAWFSNASYAPLAVGEALNDSLYFQFSSNGTSSIKLGFATNPNSPVNIYAMPTEGSWAYFGVWSLSGGFTTNSELYSDRGYIPGYLGTASGSFVNGNWYQMQFGMKQNASDIEFSWALTNSSSTGVLGTTLLSGTTTSASYSTLDTTLYSYIGLENPTPTASHRFIDNISLTSTGGMNVPEPTAMATLGLAACGLLLRKPQKQA